MSSLIKSSNLTEIIIIFVKDEIIFLSEKMSGANEKAIKIMKLEMIGK
jgi:hypothetical protein